MFGYRHPDGGTGGGREQHLLTNKLPDRLRSELAQARQLGVRAIRVEDPEFEAIVNEGTVKWVVTEDGELLVIPVPKFSSGIEISHTVLNGGRLVQAAGEAEIVSRGRRYLGININNHSGHYQPGLDTLEIGRAAFQVHDIVFPEG